jgi:hypothetical protein
MSDYSVTDQFPSRDSMSVKSRDCWIYCYCHLYPLSPPFSPTTGESRPTTLEVKSTENKTTTATHRPTVMMKEPEKRKSIFEKVSPICLDESWLCNERVPQRHQTDPYFFPVA